MLSALSLNDVGGLLFALALLIALLVWVFQSPDRRWSPRSGRVGRLASGWRWKHQAPKSFAVLRRAFWFYVIATLLTIGSIASWAPRNADAAHPVPFTMRDGQVYYIQRWLGRAIDLAIPVGCVLILGLALAGWLNRRQLVRYDPGAG